MIDWASILLLPLELSDAPRLTVWQNDPALRDLSMSIRAPISTQVMVDWLRGQNDAPLRSRVVFGIRQAGVLRGTVQLHTLDWVQRSAMLGITIGEAADRGRGLGFAASAILLDYAFRGLDLARVALTVLASNARAIRLYDRLGFTREGCMRAAYLHGGVREDVLFYGLLRDDPRPALPPEAACLVHAPAVTPPVFTP